MIETRTLLSRNFHALRIGECRDATLNRAVGKNTLHSRD